MSQWNRNKDLRYQKIYRDKNKRYIYYMQKKSQGLVIPEQDLKKWQILKIRFLIPLLFFVLTYGFWPTYLYYELSACLALLVLLELYNRKVVASYQVLNNYQPDDFLNSKLALETQEKGKLILRTTLYLTLACLLVATTLMPFNPNKILENMILYGVAVYCFYTSYVGLRILLTRKK